MLIAHKKHYDVKNSCQDAWNGYTINGKHALFDIYDPMDYIAVIAIKRQQNEYDTILSYEWITLYLAHPEYSKHYITKNVIFTDESRIQKYFYIWNHSLIWIQL